MTASIWHLGSGTCGRGNCMHYGITDHFELLEFRFLLIIKTVPFGAIIRSRASSPFGEKPKALRLKWIFLDEQSVAQKFATFRHLGTRVKTKRKATLSHLRQPRRQFWSHKQIKTQAKRNLQKHGVQPSFGRKRCDFETLNCWPSWSWSMSL